MEAWYSFGGLGEDMESGEGDRGRRELKKCRIHASFKHFKKKKKRIKMPSSSPVNITYPGTHYDSLERYGELFESE